MCDFCGSMGFHWNGLLVSHDAHAQASLVFNCWCQQFTGSFSNQPDTVRRCVNIFTNILDTVLKYIMHKLSCAARFSI